MCRALWLVILLMLSVAMAQPMPSFARRAEKAQNQSPSVQISLEVTPPVIRRGQSALLRTRLRNPLRNEIIILVATVTYSDARGNQYRVHSEPVQLTVDASIDLRLSLDLPAILKAQSATFDSQPVTLEATGIRLTLPADETDHYLLVEVVHQP